MAIIRRFLVLISLLIVASCSPWRGFLESEFDLAAQSKLPSWVLPLEEGCDRDNMTIKLQYWSTPFDVNDVVLIAKGKNCRHTKLTGTSKRPENWLTLAQQEWPNRLYPAFEIITIDEKSEVIEHKRMEPYFYVSDDKAVQERIQQLEALE